MPPIAFETYAPRSSPTVEPPVLQQVTQAPAGGALSAIASGIGKLGAAWEANRREAERDWVRGAALDAEEAATKIAGELPPDAPPQMFGERLAAWRTAYTNAAPSEEAAKDFDHHLRRVNIHHTTQLIGQQRAHALAVMEADHYGELQRVETAIAAAARGGRDPTDLIQIADSLLGDMLGKGTIAGKTAAGVSDRLRGVAREQAALAGFDAALARGGLEAAEKYVEAAEKGAATAAAPAARPAFVLADASRQLAERAAAEGIRIRITDTVRSTADQAALRAKFERGEMPGPVAPPGRSLHERGEAFDVSLQGLSAAQVKRVGEIGESLGLEWGGRWKGDTYDPVHFQLPRGTAGADPRDTDAIAARLRGRLAQVKAETATDRAELRGDVKDAVDARLLGATPAGHLEFGALYRRARALRDTDSLTALDGAAGLADAVDAFSKLPPADQQARIKALESGVSSEWDTKRLEVYRRAHAAQAKAWSEDWWAQAARAGVTEVPPLDWTSPDLAMALRARIGAADTAARFLGVPGLPLISKDETERLGATLAVLAPAEKTGLTTTLVRSLGERLPQLLEAIKDKDPTTAHAAAVAAAGAPDVAQEIIYGAGVAAAEKHYLPRKDDRWRASMDEALPPAALDAFRPEFRAGLEQAIKSAYAALAARARDTSGDVDDDRLQQAVAMVTGGVVEWNGVPTLMPRRGMTREQFRDLMRGLTDADLAGAATATGKPVGIELFRKHGYLLAVGNGQYRLRMKLANAVGGFYDITDKAGSPYILDLSQGLPRLGRAGP